MKNSLISAARLHRNVPPDWYYRSLRENLLQRYWHTRRFNEIMKLSETVKGKVLDIGSADGVFTDVILAKTRADQVIGIDVLPSSVKWASRHWKSNKKMKFLLADAHRLPFKANTFSAVYALEVLEHVFNPDIVFSEIKRVLQPGGYAVFLVPTDSWLFRFGWDYFWTKTRGKIWDDTHIQTYRNNLLVTVCRKNGFDIVESKKFIAGMLQAVKVRKK